MPRIAKPKTDRRKAPARSAAVTTTISDDAIARRAFEFYAARGGGHGEDLADWLQAERELLSSGEHAAG